VLDEQGEVVLEHRLGTTPKAMREVFGGMTRSRTALETGDALAMGQPCAERVGARSDRGPCVQRRLIGERRKKYDCLEAQTLARIDPQLLCPGDAP
jgi:transposase